MKVLITGGAGFIGSNLSNELVRRGHDVTVLDNLSPQIHGEDSSQSSLFLSLDPKVSFIHGDVRNREDWVYTIQNHDAIVHLAAETGTGQSMYEIEKYVDVNIRGTALMLDVLTNTKHNIKKLVVASSRAIYGEGRYKCVTCGIVYPEPRLDSDMSLGEFDCKCPKCGKPISVTATTEDSKIHPTSIYGITKQNQEQMVMLCGKSLDIPSVAYRYQNVFGPGQSLSNPYTGILSIFSTRILNNNGIQIFEDGLESRDFVFIDDVVHATILGLENHAGNGQVFNVGTGRGIEVKTVAKLLCENYDRGDTSISITGNYRLGDIRHNFADLTKLKDVLNYQPKVGFEEGLKRFCNWVLKQNIMTDQYEKSIEELRQKGLYK